MKNEMTQQRVQVEVESLVDGAIHTFEFMYESYDFASIQENARYILHTRSNAYLNFEEALNAIAYDYLSSMGLKGNIKKITMY